MMPVPQFQPTQRQAHPHRFAAFVSPRSWILQGPMCLRPSSGYAGGSCVRGYTLPLNAGHRILAPSGLRPAGQRQSSSSPTVTTLTASAVTIGYRPIRYLNGAWPTSMRCACLVPPRTACTVQRPTHNVHVPPAPGRNGAGVCAAARGVALHPWARRPSSRAVPRFADGHSVRQHFPRSTRSTQS